MNIFLTGSKNIGKSTIINMVLPTITFSVGGFKTLPVFDKKKKIGFELIDISTGNKGMIARLKRNDEIEVITETFDIIGVESIMVAIKSKDIILMDELGQFELGALKFRETVLKALEGDKPVLGVIQDDKNEFLDAVRNAGDTEIFVATKENREDVALTVLERLREKVLRMQKPSYMASNGFKPVNDFK
ncbi:hypothetical protein JXI42_13985 [bacterium]|nr:hypothetical protein [bacterium]